LSRQDILVDPPTRTAIMDVKFYKNIGEKLSGLTLVCNQIWPLLNEKLTQITEPDSVFPTLLRSYSAYASALNLMVRHELVWKYSRRNLALLLSSSRTMSDERRKAFEKLTSGLENTISDSVTQLGVMRSALGEFAKKYDRVKPDKSDRPDKSSTKVKSFGDVAAFLDRETVALAKLVPDVKKHNSRAAPTGSADATTNTKRGGDSERLMGIRQKMAALDVMPHKVVLGGMSGGQKQFKYSGGAEEAGRLKQELVGLSNLRRDLENFGPGDSDQALQRLYHDEVFWPQISRHFHAKNADELLAAACLSPTDRLKQMTDARPPEVHLVEQIRLCLDGPLREIANYVGKRSAKIGLADSAEPPKLPLNEVVPGGNPLEDLTKILAVFDEIARAINEEDAAIIGKHIDEDFDEINGAQSKKIDPELLKSLKSGADLLLSPDLNVLSRHQFKSDLRAAIDEIREHIVNKPSLAVHVLHVSPCAKSRDLAALPVHERMSRLLDLAEYITSIEAAVLPAYQRIEVYYDNLAALLRGYFIKFGKMIAPGNRETCVGRASSLIRSLVKCKIYPRLDQDARPVCDEIARSLFARFPAPEAQSIAEWYTNTGGLDSDVVAKLIKYFD
jgi:hypothetical protein